MPGHGQHRRTFPRGNRAATPEGRSTRKLTRADLAPYRARYITGEDIKTLAKDVKDEFDLPSVERALWALRHRCAGDGWVFQRQAYQDHLSEQILAQDQADRVQGHLDKVAADGDYLVTTGMEALKRLPPKDVGEALEMVRLGATLGLRGRNLPEKVRMPSIVPLLTATGAAASAAAQQLSPVAYEALADACDAEFAALPPGPAAPGGDQ